MRINDVNKDLLLQMKRMHKNKQLQFFGLNIGDYTEDFQKESVEGREMESMFFGGKPSMGLGYDGKWILDVSKFFHIIDFVQPPKTEEDYIHPFVTLLNYCVIEELIHSLTKLSHKDYSRREFMIFVSKVLEIECEEK